MNTHEIKCFQAVYEAKSLNGAARSLYITAQGLGKIINNLELELKTQLFERSAKGLLPTESGRALYNSAAQLLEDFAALEQAIRQVGEKEKKLRIHCARGVLNALSFQVIASFMEQFPQIEVIWREAANNEVKHAVSVFAADVGLVVGQTENPQIHQELINQKYVCILVYEGHPYYDRQVLSLQDLAQERIIILNEHYQVYHDYRRATGDLDIEPEIVAMSEDSHFIYKLCKQKYGLGVLLDFSVDEFSMQNIRAIPLKEKLTWDIHAICQKEALGYPNIERFLEHVKK